MIFWIRSAVAASNFFAVPWAFWPRSRNDMALSCRLLDTVLWARPAVADKASAYDSIESAMMLWFATSDIWIVFWALFMACISETISEQSCAYVDVDNTNPKVRTVIAFPI